MKSSAVSPKTIPFVMKHGVRAHRRHRCGPDLAVRWPGAFYRPRNPAMNSRRRARLVLMGRSKRYAMLVDDGVVKLLHAEESPGTCEISGGEALLAAL